MIGQDAVRREQQPLTKPPWPYENLSSFSDGRDDTYSKELAFDDY